jgi:hypothetical protein
MRRFSFVNECHKTLTNLQKIFFLKTSKTSRYKVWTPDWECHGSKKKILFFFFCSFAFINRETINDRQSFWSPWRNNKEKDTLILVNRQVQKLSALYHYPWRIYIIIILQINFFFSAHLVSFDTNFSIVALALYLCLASIYFSLSGTLQMLFLLMLSLSSPHRVLFLLYRSFSSLNITQESIFSFEKKRNK